jgi:hypothetical protein
MVSVCLFYRTSSADFCPLKDNLGQRLYSKGNIKIMQVIRGNSLKNQKQKKEK